MAMAVSDPIKHFCKISCILAHRLPLRVSIIYQVTLAQGLMQFFNVIFDNILPSKVVHPLFSTVLLPIFLLAFLNFKVRSLP